MGIHIRNNLFLIPVYLEETTSLDEQILSAIVSIQPALDVGICISVRGHICDSIIFSSCSERSKSDPALADAIEG